MLYYYILEIDAPCPMCIVKVTEEHKTVLTLIHSFNFLKKRERLLHCVTISSVGNVII